MTDLWRLSAGELALCAANGAASVTEIVDSHLERIVSVGDEVNAIVDVMASSARAEAARLDAQHAAGLPARPLHGVPWTVKAEFDVAGSPSTAGVVALRDRMPEADSPAVQRLRQAGCVIIGRTNEPDLGQRMHTECDLYGATLNPWDRSVTPGGSSGGDAVALATGMTALGLGSDMGGSCRIPAYCCGVTGLKPSLGRVPRYGSPDGVSISEQLTCVAGPLARSVGDLRLALRALEGADPRDPDAVPTPPRDEAALRDLRVAAAAPPSGESWTDGVAGALEAAGSALESAGCRVTEVELPRVKEVFETFLTLVLADGADTSPEGLEYSDDVRRFWNLLRAAFPCCSPGSLGQALADRFALAWHWSNFLSDYPLVIAPVWTCAPWPVGYDVRGQDEAMQVFWNDRFSLCANLLGLPAVAVPTGVVGNLPTGVQLIGRRFSDDLCLSAAEQIERCFPSGVPIDPRWHPLESR